MSLPGRFGVTCLFAVCGRFFKHIAGHSPGTDWLQMYEQDRYDAQSLADWQEQVNWRGW